MEMVKTISSPALAINGSAIAPVPDHTTSTPATFNAGKVVGSNVKLVPVLTMLPVTSTFSLASLNSAGISIVAVSVVFGPTLFAASLMVTSAVKVEPSDGKATFGTIAM